MALDHSRATQDVYQELTITQFPVLRYALSLESPRKWKACPSMAPDSMTLKNDGTSMNAIEPAARNASLFFRGTSFSVYHSSKGCLSRILHFKNWNCCTKPGNCCVTGFPLSFSSPQRHSLTPHTGPPTGLCPNASQAIQTRASFNNYRE